MILNKNFSCYRACILVLHVFAKTTKEDEILHRWFLGKMVCEWRGRMIHVMIFQEGVAMLMAVGNEATLQSL